MTSASSRGAHVGTPEPLTDGDGWPWTSAPEPSATWRSDADSIRISVIVPSFNQGQFLEQTLRSILLQGYGNLELFVVDGGSSDNSREVIEHYDGLISWWVSEPDNGQSEAINKGFDRATGDVVAWLNSDDRYAPGTLHAVNHEFRTRPDAAVIYGDLNLIDGAGVEIRTQVLPAFDPTAIMDHSVAMPQPATFIRRSAVREPEFLNPVLHYAMDFDLWLRLMRSGRFEHVDRVLADFRLWEESKSTAHKLHWAPELVSIADRFFSDPDLPDSLQRLRRPALSGILSTAAVYSFEGGDRRAARRLMARAVATHPASLARGRLAARATRVFLGDSVFEAARRLRRRPGAGSKGGAP